MTAIYDPELCERLIATVASGLQYAELKQYAEQLEAARTEVERMTRCMNVAGLQCFIRGGAPEQVADHMRRVSGSWMENEAKLTAERDELRCNYLLVADALLPASTGPQQLADEARELRRAVDALQKQIEAVGPVVDASMRHRDYMESVARGCTCSVCVAVIDYRARSKP